MLLSEPVVWTETAPGKVFHWMAASLNLRFWSMSLKFDIKVIREGETYPCGNTEITMVLSDKGTVIKCTDDNLHMCLVREEWQLSLDTQQYHTLTPHHHQHLLQQPLKP